MNVGYEYLFGPVPSRRLGRSLGVDLIPFKTCTMDCTYCQLGETTCEISDRGDYVPMQDVLAELERWKAVDGQADHITLAGSGEPTLHLHFGDVLEWTRDNTCIPSVLLTNGTLMHDEDVRRQASIADKVKVTLSAWDEASFQRIHRPAQGVTFDLLVKGERAFREQYCGELSVEVFIIEGVNASELDVKRIAEVVRTINPDRIDINTAVRPPAVDGIRSASPERLQAIAEMFGERAAVAASFRRQGFTSIDLSEEAILSLLRRHPATSEQMAQQFNLPLAEATKALRSMVRAGQLAEESRDGEAYFRCNASG